MMFDSPSAVEVNRLVGSLDNDQIQDLTHFETELESMSGIFGCPSLWTIYQQAWLLDHGFKLEHCNHETAESLLGMTVENICKLKEKIAEKTDV